VLGFFGLDKILLFSNNVFYEKWNKNNERFYLLNYLLPSEDLEDVNLLSQNSKSIEDYDFKEIIKKYDLNDFIITIIYKNNNDLKILSKIQLNQFFKIDNQAYENIELSNEKDLELVLTNLKISYENYWKNINQINTSIKLPLTITVNAISDVRRCLSSPVSISFLLFKNHGGKLEDNGFFIVFYF